MTESNSKIELLLANTDRQGVQRSLGVSTVQFKVTAVDTDDLFVIENRFHQPGGPARHLHEAQDEWFYVLEGTFAFEVGESAFNLVPGDAIFAPRQIPHVWACVSPGGGRLLITFTPAGQMAAFFEWVTQANAMPPLDPALWQAHGMQLLGPPLAV